MAVLVADGHPKSVLIPWIREALGNPHNRLPVCKEIGVSVFLLRKVGVQVEIVRVHLDQPDKVIGGNRKPEAATMSVHEIRDFSLTAFVKVFGFEVEARNRTSERIAKQLHFRLPGAFTPSALRNTR